MQETIPTNGTKSALEWANFQRFAGHVRVLVSCRGVSIGERRVAGFAQRPMNVNALEWSIPVPQRGRGREG